jgi:hypothetical protein
MTMGQRVGAAAYKGIVIPAYILIRSVRSIIHIGEVQKSRDLWIRVTFKVKIFPKENAVNEMHHLIQDLISDPFWYRIK